jgi:TATA-box binding protein (TBP) (component of TFIID and TFIIIB)
MNEFTQVIKDLGFPIFVSVYMLIKGSKDTEQHTKALNELKSVIQEFINSCKRE